MNYNHGIRSLSQRSFIYSLIMLFHYAESTRKFRSNFIVSLSGPVNSTFKILISVELACMYELKKSSFSQTNAVNVVSCESTLRSQQKYHK